MNSNPTATLVMTPAEVGAVLDLSEEELRAMRLTNHGPAFYALGGRLVRYNTTDVYRWYETRGASYGALP